MGHDRAAWTDAACVVTARRASRGLRVGGERCEKGQYDEAASNLFHGSSPWVGNPRDFSALAYPPSGAVGDQVLLTEGIAHEPSRIEGSFSSGQ